MISKDLTLGDWVKNIEGDLGKTEWVTVFALSGFHEDVDRGTYFSALIANDKIGGVLKKHDWDLRISGGLPGFCTHYVDGKSITEYYRFSDEGIEPLVYWRTFSGKKESYYEISEEFRLYFNLFEKLLDRGEKVFIYTNDDGDEDDVVKVGKESVSIKLKYIKEFLAVKQMHLAIYFEAMRFSDKTLEEVGLSKIDEDIKGKDYVYMLCIRNLDLGDTKSQGWLLGKKIISGTKHPTPLIWESKEEEKYEEFIIGVDEDGRAVFCSCNTDYQETPGFLTPIFFKREVLKKYYDYPEKYSVKDGYAGHDGFWGLRIMNNHRYHVVVWLGDLKSLPYKEQNHWRAFNLTPGDKKISHADFTRNIEGQFADPDHPELYFKYKFDVLQKSWHEKFGWYIFRPLSEGDAYHMKSLHVPTTNDQKEFDEQVASMTKIIIDSLNEKELSKDFTLSKDVKSIGKFENYLKSHDFYSAEMIEFLRNLQSLRSTGVAHCKGSKYEKVKVFFGIGDKELQVIFENILIKCIWILNALEKNFIANE